MQMQAWSDSFVRKREYEGHKTDEAGQDGHERVVAGTRSAAAAVLSFAFV